MTVGTPDSLGTWRSWRAGVKPSARGDGWQSEAVGRQGGLTCSAPGISPDVLGPETAGQLPRSFVCVEKLCPVNGSHSRVATGLLPPRSIPRASPGGFSPGRGLQCGRKDRQGGQEALPQGRAGPGRAPGAIGTCGRPPYILWPPRSPAHRAATKGRPGARGRALPHGQRLQIFLQEDLWR